MTHGSLFSGIGGFDLAAEWMGWENKFHCEWNPFGQKVLKYYWPEAESFNDITKTDFTKYANRISILTGGFPCQPYSTAGKRKGKEDDRHLWPEMLRCIGEVKPRWVVGENVLGLVNWNDGLVFHEVQSDLEAEGYEVFPYVLPAASVGAPHRRDRVWFVAFNTKSNRSTQVGGICERENNESIGVCESNGNVDATDTISIRPQKWSKTGNIQSKEGKAFEKRCESSISIETNGGGHRPNDVANTNGIRLRGQGNRVGKSGFIGKNEPGNYWETFPTVSPICDGNDGFSDRLDGITFSKWRNESIKAGGNAIVPQVAYQIFKSIEIYDANH